MLHVTFSVVFVRTPLKCFVIKDFSDAREEMTPAKQRGFRWCFVEASFGES